MPHLTRRTRMLAVALAVGLATSAAGAACALVPGAQQAQVRTSADSAGTTGSAGAAAGALAKAPIRYVAMGDSFTAAPGVPDSAGGGCIRSTNNYPSVLARVLLSTQVVDVSCSAANTRHLFTSQKTVIGDYVPPQFAALTPETDLITIGMGGNDFNVFGTVINQCPLEKSKAPGGAPCRDAMRTRNGDRLVNKIERTEERLVKVVERARERSPQARIMLVGYPQIVPSKGRCAKLPLAKGDYAYAVKINRKLDRAVRSAAKRTDAEFINRWAASQGHDVCAKVPWIQGKDSDGSAIFYHPFAAEQSAVAEIILSKLI